MNHTLRLLLISALLLILSACSSKPVTLQTQSHQEVHYQAPLQAESYSWTQLSGVEVTLPEPESQTLRFIAPVVTQEEILLFELEAKSGESVKVMRVRVIISPVASDTEDNTTTGGDNNVSTGGGTDTNTSTGGDNNATTGGGSEDDNATGGGDDSNTSSGGSDSSSTTGGDSNATGGGSDDGNATGGGSDSNTTTVTLKALSLTLANTTLNKDRNTTVEVTATYTDNTTKEVTDQVTWVATPSDAIQINNAVLTARKDTTVTIQAKIGSTLSNQATLNIYWEVNGHRLPLEPDLAVNNSTLLGVDVNGNGVRDDVERWIYTKYKEYKICHKQSEGNYTLPDGKVVPIYNVHAKEICSKPIPYHPVVRAVAMQGARAAQIIIQEPEKAKEMGIIFESAYFCSFALRDHKDKSGRELYKDYIFGKEFKKIQFNTAQRAKAFAKYNYYLSGGVYSSPPHEVMQKRCSQEVKELLKDLK